MAARFDVADMKRGSTYSFPPEELDVPAEMNGRHDLPPIEWLIESIVAQGQLTPVQVRNNGGKPRLVSGFSRWRAIVEINKRKLTPVRLPIICVLYDGNDQAAYLANLAENVQRNDLTAMDEAHVCAQLSKWGMSLEQIAERFPKRGGSLGEHQKPAWVKTRIRLYGAVPEVQQAVTTGKLKPTAAAHIATLADAQQREAVKENAAPKPPETRKPSFIALRLLIEAAVNDGKYPAGITGKTSTENFCSYMLDWMNGEKGG